MFLPCDVKVQFLKSARDSTRFRLKTEVAVQQDDFGHLILFVGPKERKQTFQLEKNISGIFDSFSNDGKASLSLKAPEVHVFIQNANVDHLKLFTQLLKDIQQYPYLDLEIYAEQKKLPKRSETTEGAGQRGRPKKKAKTGEDGDDTAEPGDDQYADDDDGGMNLASAAAAKKSASNSKSAAAGQKLANSLLSNQKMSHYYEDYDENGGTHAADEADQYDDDLAGFIVGEDEELDDGLDDSDADSELERAERRRKKQKRRRQRSDSSSSSESGKEEEDSVPSEEM